MNETARLAELEARGHRLVARRAGAWAAGLFVLLQLLIPLGVLSRGQLSSRDFAWDMFSYQLTCQELQVVVREAGGEWESVRLDVDFSSWAQLRRLLSEARFRAYARRLCGALRAERGVAVELHLWSRCSTDRAGASFALLDPARDFCAGP